MSLNPHLYAIVAGELSGDTLGAGLMAAIRRLDPQASFIGIGGPGMIKQGMKSAARLEALSVMGISEVVSHLIPILRIRKQVQKLIINARPCVMIGIDSPDFNLSLERKVRQSGIPTVHYVSPSVWAWREGRMKKIRASCDEVLALLKFEKEFYDKEQMACTYVGHALANQIALETDVEKSRERVDLYRNSVDRISGKVMGILPGSRAGVIDHMFPVYAQAARLIRAKLPDVAFVTTVPSYALAVRLKDMWLEANPDLSLTVYVGCTRDVIASCDALLLTSGTVALETMLINRPFCVAYKVSPLTAAIGRRMLRISTYSLPNLIAKTTLVKELIQEQCTPQALCDEMLKLLNSDNLIMKGQFKSLHEQMRMPSDELAAEAVMRVARKALDAERAAGQAKNDTAFKDDIEPKVTLPEAASANYADKVEPSFDSGAEERRGAN